MNMKRSGIAALVAILSISFSVSANAEMVRAFWAGSITDAVQGNAYELAIGSKLLATMDFNTDWMDMVSGFAPNESMAVTANFFTNPGTFLSTDQTNLNPIFTGEIRFLDGMIWQAVDAGGIIAEGTWSLDSIKFPPRVISIPAALPLMLGALGILGSLRRRT